MFNDDEKNLAEKRLVVMSEELDHIKFLAQHNMMMVEVGLESNFKAKLREFKEQSKDLKAEIEDKEFTINTLTDQCENGVEELDPVSDVEYEEVPEVEEVAE